VPRAIAKTSDIDSCGLTLSELQELWLGAHPTTGSCFCTREELVAAWAAGRAVVMRLWGSHGRRPAGFYEFEWEGSRPAYDVERSTLWRAGVLSAEEKAELEREWRCGFETAQTPDFSMNTGCEILTGARAQTAHYRWADVPAELVQRWTAEHKRRRRRGAPLEEAVTGVAK